MYSKIINGLRRSMEWDAEDLALLFYEFIEKNGGQQGLDILDEHMQIAAQGQMDDRRSRNRVSLLIERYQEKAYRVIVFDVDWRGTSTVQDIFEANDLDLLKNWTNEAHKATHVYGMDIPPHGDVFDAAVLFMRDIWEDA